MLGGGGGSFGSGFSFGDGVFPPILLVSLLVFLGLFFVDLLDDFLAHLVASIGRPLSYSLGGIAVFVGQRHPFFGGSLGCGGRGGGLGLGGLGCDGEAGRFRLGPFVAPTISPFYFGTTGGFVGGRGGLGGLGWAERVWDC